tara:strand:+ start:433 stop:552 length:120 start_codon:yes stop_codon:yes gene_type:complete
MAGERSKEKGDIKSVIVEVQSIGDIRFYPIRYGELMVLE